MKKNLLLLPLLLMVIMTNAQITVTNTAFASPGQMFETNIVNGLQRIDITPAGPNQTWDMADLQGTAVDFTATAASTGSSFALFPSSTLILPEIGGIAGDGYVKVETNQMSTIGVVATIDGFVSNFPVPLTTPRIDMQTPMNYNNMSSSSFGFQVALDPHNPTGTQLDSLITALEVGAGGLLQIDSIRVTFTTNRTSEVDAWGNLTTPKGTYDVLRLKKTDLTNTTLHVKISVFGIPNVLWQDPADPNGLNVDPSSLPFIGVDTIITYEFWDATEQQPILKCLTDASGTPTYGQYARSASSTKGVDFSNGKVYAYPNPATDNFTLELSNFEAGDYTLKMYNIIGKEVKSIDFRYSGDTKMLVPTEDLKAGTYIYRIITEDNESLISRRIIIVKP